MKKEVKKSQLMMLMVLIMCDELILSEEQVGAIFSILMAAQDPNSSSSALFQMNNGSETVRGMTELAQFLGVSVPTACKISRTGKFDEARLSFGTKKFIWDRSKLMELAKKK